jgi:hypothetical protein
MGEFVEFEIVQRSSEAHTFLLGGLTPLHTIDCRWVAGLREHFLEEMVEDRSGKGVLIHNDILDTISDRRRALFLDVS